MITDVRTQSAKPRLGGVFFFPADQKNTDFVSVFLFVRILLRRLDGRLIVAPVLVHRGGNHQQQKDCREYR